MMTFYFQIAAATVLICAAFVDMRKGRVPNWIPLCLVGVFAVYAVTVLSLETALWHIAFGAMVFAFGLVLYFFTRAGAGAMKMMAAAALFLPMERAGALLLLFFGTMFIIGIVIAMMHKFSQFENSGWVFLSTRVIPLSLPIGATSLLGMFWL